MAYTYYLPQNPQCTSSPTALKQYLQYSVASTQQLESLCLVTNYGIAIMLLPSIQHFIDEKMLDYILLNVVHPKNCPTICLPIANYTSAPTLTHAPVHQYLAHIEEDKLDTMCRKQSMIGLPK